MLNRIEAGLVTETRLMEMVFPEQTRSTAKIDFHVPVRQGQLVELVSRIASTGRTSITVDVDLYSEDLLTGDRQLGTRGRFVLVALDPQGKPTGVPPLQLPSMASSDSRTEQV
jgi:acyl-CoA hydrolase